MIFLKGTLKGCDVFVNIHAGWENFQARFSYAVDNGRHRRKGVVPVSECDRHELKYAIDMGACLALRQRLRPVMQPDSHAGPDGRYTIHSIYFDNADDKALREKLSGVSRREKWRVRWYNDDLGYIRLEKKMKRDALCRKLSAPLTEGECRALAAGRLAWMPEHPEALVRELYGKCRAQQLAPRVLVSYEREAYVYAPGNVRVTFDTRLRTSLYHRELLDGERGISAMDSPGVCILEVKYDAFLPEVIRCLLQCDVRQQAFSKYGACRRFG